MSRLPFLTDDAMCPEPASGERARARREEWRAAATELGGADESFANALVGDSRACDFLDGVFGNAPALGRALVREPTQLREAAEQGPNAAFASALDEISDAARVSGDRRVFARRLRGAKRRASLTVALADLAGAWPLDRVAQALTRLADAVLASALDHLLREAAARGTIAPPKQDEPPSYGLTVFGVGGLGAGELTYSSELDLLVLFDPERVRHQGRGEPAEALHRLVRDLAAVLGERDDDGCVYRTDLKFRPNTGSTPLALSTAAAEQYYESHGQNWERAAMIKARPAAGDMAVGADMIERLRPFIWRKYLDLSAIQDIQSIKRQINAEPSRQHFDVAGHDIERGRGGIRQIELYAQTQQLIWGGRDDSLRSRATCDALKALAAAERTSEVAVDALIDSYRFLRRLEHRIEMIDDEPALRIPDDADARAALARLMGFADEAAFTDALHSHVGAVEGHYAALFEDEPALGDEGGNLVFTGTDDDPDTLASLERMGFGDASGVSATVRRWHHGRIQATRSTRARELLTELMPALLRALSHTADPDSAFRKLDEFLAGLPSGVQPFLLLHDNPGLLAQLAEILGSAPRIAEHLSRSPDLLEGLISGDLHQRLPNRDELIDDLAQALAPAGDYDDVLDGVRRWQHEREFQVGMQILRGDVAVDQLSGALSDIADTVIETLLPRVHQDFVRRHGSVPGAAFAVLGMGKLGSRELTFDSDLDVVFLYGVLDGAEAQSDGAQGLAPSHYYTRFTKRLSNAVSALTAEGRLYEIDTRLRPSGTSGPIATEAAAFRRYHEEDSWTWEHMALTRARPVAGDPDLAASVMADIRAVLCTPRDADTLLADVAAMRERIDGERHTENRWRLKHVRGGLLDLEFIAQYHLLRHAARHPSILVQSTQSMYRRLGEAGVLAADDASELAEMLAFLQRLQGLLRLTVGTNREVDRFTPGVRETLARAMGTDDFAALEGRIVAIQDRVRAAYHRLVAAPAAALDRKNGE